MNYSPDDGDLSNQVTDIKMSVPEGKEFNVPYPNEELGLELDAILDDDSDEDQLAESAPLAEQFPELAEDELIASTGSFDEMGYNSVTGEITHELESLLYEQPNIVGYNSRAEQAAVFGTVIPYRAALEEESILDVGCGIGDLYAYIIEYLSLYEDAVDYTGIDKNEKMIKYAKIKFPQISNKFNNILLEDNDLSEKKYDWVVAGSVFNLKEDVSNNSVKDYITMMYDLSNKGVGINLLSRIPEGSIDPDDKFITHDPVELFDWAQKEFKQITLINEYLTGDFCLHIYK